MISPDEANTFSKISLENQMRRNQQIAANLLEKCDAAIRQTAQATTERQASIEIREKNHVLIAQELVGMLKARGFGADWTIAQATTAASAEMTYIGSTKATLPESCSIVHITW